MKAIGLCLLVGGLIVMSLGLAACDGVSATESALSDEELAALQAELDETGGLNVDTLAVAEAVAGFAVAVPSYLPEGFYLQENIIVTKLGARLPEDMKPPNQPITVETFYFLEGDDKVMFTIQQTPWQMGLGGGQPAEICGLQGERKYLEADPDRLYPSRILTMACQKDGTTYTIYATLTGPLDEATVEQIFCSLLD